MGKLRVALIAAALAACKAGPPGLSDAAPEPSGEYRGIAVAPPTLSHGQPFVAPAASGAPVPCLTSEQVKQLMNAYRLGLAPACWDGNPTPLRSVNVSVSFTIGRPDGATTDVSARGEEPATAKCVEDQVRAWRFPTSCMLTINFAFTFTRD